MYKPFWAALFFLSFTYSAALADDPTSESKGWGGVAPAPSERECRSFIEAALKEQRLQPEAGGGEGHELDKEDIVGDGQNSVEQVHEDSITEASTENVDSTEPIEETNQAIDETETSSERNLEEQVLSEEEDAGRAPVDSIEANDEPIETPRGSEAESETILGEDSAQRGVLGEVDETLVVSREAETAALSEEGDGLATTSGEVAETTAASGEAAATSGEGEETAPASGEADVAALASAEAEDVTAASGEAGETIAASGEGGEATAVSGEVDETIPASGEAEEAAPVSGGTEEPTAASAEAVEATAASGEAGEDIAATSGEVEGIAATSGEAAELPEISGEAQGEETQPVSGEASEAQPISGEVDEAQPVSGEVDKAQPASGEVEESQPASGEVSEAQPASGEVDEAQPISGEADEAQPVSGEVDDAQPVSGEVNEPQPVSGEFDEAHPISGEVQEISPDSAEAGIVKRSIEDEQQPESTAETVATELKDKEGLATEDAPSSEVPLAAETDADEPSSDEDNVIASQALEADSQEEPEQLTETTEDASQTPPEDGALSAEVPDVASKDVVTEDKSAEVDQDSIKESSGEPAEPSLVESVEVDPTASKETAPVTTSSEIPEGTAAIETQTEEVSAEVVKEEQSVDIEEETPETEDLTLRIEIPENLRPRDHIFELLKLDSDSADIDAKLFRAEEITLRDLKKVYESAIKPLEVLYKYRDLSNRHFGDSEIFSKPLIVFMGPWSGGKSTVINYLLDNEYKPTALRTGAEPSPAYFNIVMWGEREEVLDGTQLAADWTFSGLQKFGQGLLDRLRGLKLNHPLLEKVNIVEIPGILEIRKQVERLFPLNDACQWFIDRADIIFLIYDPSKLDVGPETEAILDQLKGREYQTKIILNKADQVKPEELMRVQGTLIWNISPLMSSTEPPVMYTTSLWSHPYQPGSPSRLLFAQEKSFLKDFREAMEKRVENKISSARRFAVRVRNHAKMVDCYLTTYYNHKTFFGDKQKVSEDIIEHPQNYHIYEGLSTLTNISRYDLPDPDVYKDFFRLNPVYDFQQLSSTCTIFRGCPINRLDVAIAYDLPELIGRYKKMSEDILKKHGKK